MVDLSRNHFAIVFIACFLSSLARTVSSSSFLSSNKDGYWTQANVPSTYWTAVASDSSGQNLLVETLIRSIDHPITVQIGLPLLKIVKHGLMLFLAVLDDFFMLLPHITRYIEVLIMEAVGIFPQVCLIGF